MVEWLFISQVSVLSLKSTDFIESLKIFYDEISRIWIKKLVFFCELMEDNSTHIVASSDCEPVSIPY